MSEWVITAIVLLAVFGAAWFFGRVKPSQFKAPDEKNLNSAFDEARMKERQANDARTKDIENEDRLRLLNDLNRR